MREAALLGALGGILGGALQLAAMCTTMPYAAWTRANGALLVAFCAALVWLGARAGRARRPGAGLLAPVAAAVGLFAGLNLLAYAVATGPLVEHVRQLPFFVNSPTYRGYPSAQAYLTTPGNYGALFRLQMFTWIVVAALQLALGGGVAAARAARRPGRRGTAGGGVR